MRTVPFDTFLRVLAQLAEVEFHPEGNGGLFFWWGHVLRWRAHGARVYDDTWIAAIDVDLGLCRPVIRIGESWRSAAANGGAYG